MRLEISIQNVQSIKKIDFSVNLADKSLVCITGRNGSGKTTLIKAIKNLISADTFLKTSSARIFSPNSQISYKIDEKSIVFKYDEERKIIESRDLVPAVLRKKMFIELPIPHGERFNFFQRIGEIDPGLRSQVVLKRYSPPKELIDFLESVYATKKFDKLVEIRIKNVPYYAIVFDDNYYLREDYFSSGEYFLISLYRRVISGYMAIFIDEIDISLDAAAQVRLVEWLRKFKEIYSTTFVFTTHSLPMMRMLEPSELFHMEERHDGSTVVENRSYAFIKSTLFGFSGWDKYVLTEDDVLKEFLEHFIAKYCKPSFYKHKIIYVGGGTNTTNLMERNKVENFFSKNSKSVIVILDGDQKDKSHAKKDGVYCIPIQSVEKELLARCFSGEFGEVNKLRTIIDDYDRLVEFVNGRSETKPNRVLAFLYGLILKVRQSTSLRRKLGAAQGNQIKDKDVKNAGKKLFKYLIASKEYPQQEIFEFLIKKNPTEMDILRRQIEDFICLD